MITNYLKKNKNKKYISKQIDNVKTHVFKIYY